MIIECTCLVRPMNEPIVRHQIVTEQPVGLQHHTDPRRNGALGLFLHFLHEPSDADQP